MKCSLDEAGPPFWGKPHGRFLAGYGDFRNLTFGLKASDFWVEGSIEVADALGLMMLV